MEADRRLHDFEEKGLHRTDEKGICPQTDLRKVDRIKSTKQVIVIDEEKRVFYEFVKK